MLRGGVSIQDWRYSENKAYLSWSQNYNVHCSLDAVMDSIRNYDTSETENDSDTDCSASETRLQLPVNQVQSVYLLAVSKNNLHACRHVAQRFTTILAFSVLGKDLFLYILLFPTVNKNLPFLSEWREQHILRPIQRFTSKTVKYESVTQLFLKDRL